MKYNKVFLLLSLMIFLWNCEDEGSTKASSSLDPDDILGTWLVTSSLSNINVQPSIDIDFVDYYSKGNGSIEVSGLVDASLEYMLSLSDSSFTVSNYPLNNYYNQEDAVIYQFYNSSYYGNVGNIQYSDGWDDWEYLQENNLSINDVSINTQTFTVTADHLIPSYDIIEYWYDYDYSLEGQFIFNLVDNQNSVQIEVTVDYNYYESEWNIYRYESEDYYFSENREFGDYYETNIVDINLPQGMYAIHIWEYDMGYYDNYANYGGVSGTVSLSQNTEVNGNLEAATKSIASGEIGEVFSSDQESIQTMTFNGDGTVILSYTEDENDDDFLDLWYIDDNGDLIIIDGEEAGDEDDIYIKFSMENSDNGKIIKSSMEWCEYINESDEEDCNMVYRELESELLINENSLDNIYQEVEFNLQRLGYGLVP